MHGVGVQQLLAGHVLSDMQHGLSWCAMPATTFCKRAFWVQWGENGFLRLRRDLPGTGHLGLLSIPGYPLKIHPNPGQLGTGYGQIIDQHGMRAGLTSAHSST